MMPPRSESAGSMLQRLGPYQLLEKLSSYGTVQPYAARKDGAFDLCIVKRLLTELKSNPAAQSRFRREALIARTLDHPNLVRALDVGTDGDVFYLVTEFLVGTSLERMLDRLRGNGGHVPLPELGGIACGLLKGVGYAHRMVDADGRPLNVVHRDLAPRSLIVTFSGEVKVNDFGVARAEVDDFRTLPGMAVGSVPYMSPEQATGHPLDPRSDLYALGTVLYELCTGRRAVPEGSLLDMLKTVAREAPPPLSTLRPDLPSALHAVVDRAMTKDPGDRWPDAAAFEAALETALEVPVADADALGAFARSLLPDEEQEILQLMERIREVGATLSFRAAELSKDQAAIETEQTRPRSPLESETAGTGETEAPLALVERDAEEPPEPSVMTMPGALMEPGAETAPPPVAVVMGTPLSPRPNRTWLLGLAVPLLVGLLAFFAVSSGPEDSPASSRDPTAPVREVARLAPAVPPSPSTAVPSAPTAAVPSAPGPAVVARSPTPRAQVVPRSSPARRKARSGRRPPALSPPADAPKTANEGSPVPPPPAADGAMTVKRALDARTTRLRGLRRRLNQLQASPRDPQRFEALHAALSREARGLPPAVRRAVRADLNAAQLAFDSEPLSAALSRMEEAWAAGAVPR